MSGAGVVLPDSYTRVGEMPQISRPMMQRMITEEPAQVQLHRLGLTRRTEELEALRARAVVELTSKAPIADVALRASFAPPAAPADAADAVGSKAAAVEPAEAAPEQISGTARSHPVNIPVTSGESGNARLDDVPRPARPVDTASPPVAGDSAAPAVAVSATAESGPAAAPLPENVALAPQAAAVPPSSPRPVQASPIAWARSWHGRYFAAVPMHRIFPRPRARSHATFASHFNRFGQSSSYSSYPYSYPSYSYQSQ